MKKILALLIAASLVACHQKEDGSCPKAAIITNDTCIKYHRIDHVGTRIKIEEIPACNILCRDYQGNYQQHPAAFPELMGYAAKNYTPAGCPLGIYPDDPDAVPEVMLQWIAGIRVLPLKETATEKKTTDDPFDVNATPAELSIPLAGIKKPETPYALKTLPQTTAITLETTLEKAGIDGLAMNAWLIINGYVQTAPTRMEFAMTKTAPGSVPVKISIPAAKRKSGLTLITAN